MDILADIEWSIWVLVYFLDTDSFLIEVVHAIDRFLFGSLS